MRALEADDEKLRLLTGDDHGPNGVTGVVVDWIGGNCPVQAEGTIDGEPFYFRARGQHWVCEIGIDRDIGGSKWDCIREYGSHPYGAGWMTEAEARGFIAEAAEIWREIQMIEDDTIIAICDDGQPDEAQEWRDYDPDC